MKHDISYVIYDQKVANMVRIDIVSVGPMLVEMTS